MTAVAGLYIAPAPDIAHYLPFFSRLSVGNQLGSGIATGLAAVVAAIIFVSLGMWIMKRKFLAFIMYPEVFTKIPGPL